MNLDAIRARVGAQSPTALSHLTPSVRKIVTEDVPALIAIVEEYCTPHTPKTELSMLRELRMAAERVYKATAEFPNEPSAWDEPMQLFDQKVEQLRDFYPAVFGINVILTIGEKSCDSTSDAAKTSSLDGQTSTSSPDAEESKPT